MNILFSVVFLVYAYFLLPCTGLTCSQWEAQATTNEGKLLFAETLKDYWDGYFQSLTEDALGYSWAVRKDGYLVSSGTYGYSDTVQHAQQPGVVRIALTDSTRLRIASLAKLVTSTLAFHLAEDASIDLDDTVWNRLQPRLNGQVHDGFKNVKLKQFLAHRSGLGQRQISGVDKNHLDLYVRELLKRAPVYSNTGSVYSYENENYYVVRMFIEESTGQEFGHLLTSYHLHPLGIHDVSCNGTDQGETWIDYNPRYLYSECGAGGIHATPIGLSKLFAKIRLGQVYSNATYMNEMIHGGYDNYHYAWQETFTTMNGNSFGHNGAWTYNGRKRRSAGASYPKGFDIVLLATSDSFTPRPTIVAGYNDCDLCACDIDIQSLGMPI